MLVLEDASDDTRIPPVTRAVFATPLSVIASQAPTRLPIHFKSVDVDALLIAVSMPVRDLFAVCAEAIPKVTRCGEISLADQPP